MGTHPVPMAGECAPHRCTRGGSSRRYRTVRLPLARHAALAAILALAAACGPPIYVSRVAPWDVYRADSASILESGEPSRFTRIVIHRAALDETFERDRKATIRVLHRSALEDGGRDELLALAELCFLEGQARGRASDYLGAAVYAYLFLFDPPDESEWADEWDPRPRIAADVYNRSLARAFSSNGEGDFVFTAGPHRLPVGVLEVRTPRTAFEWTDGVRFERFLPADEFEVHGLASRYRRPGLGAPLIAKRTTPWRSIEDRDPFPPKAEAPATAFLRVAGGREALRAGWLAGTLELYDAAVDRTVEINGRRVPLEVQNTTAIAHLLGETPTWKDFEIAGFLRGSDRTVAPGMYLLQPYRPGRIPVVLVHGTASSPPRWADLYNELQNDPRTADRFQFWFFAYSTGNPIPYSAWRLRAALAATIDRLDPEHRDAALAQMVMIGHSQGGLLTRLAVSRSGNLFWENVSDVPFDQLEIDPESRALLRDVIFFEPVPNVRRVVFLATPHRGSYVAGGFFGGIGSRLVMISGDILRIPFAALRARLGLAARAGVDKASAKVDLSQHVPTAVDAMMPGNSFVETLKQVPMGECVRKHSIIAVRGGQAGDGGNDGVVAYESAHIDGVESELVVDSSHSLQSNPHTVAEVRRILIEHLRAVDEEASGARPACP